MRLTMKGRNGSLHRFTQKVKNKRGEIVEYPKVRGERDPDNVKHWKWKLTWKEKVDEKWRTRCAIVPSGKVVRVQRSISENVGIEEIRRFLG